MDRLDAMRLFVTAVDEGSLAAAARRHGRSPAAVTRAVAVLERYAGTALLLRSTRKLSLTTAGEGRLTLWRDVLTRLGEVEPEESGGSIQGGMVLTVPELFGRLRVMPLVESFLRMHPHVDARILMVNRIVNLVGEGVDLAVRLAPLPDSTLTAIKIGQVRALFCASPEYLASRVAPIGLGDLARHDCIGLNAGSDAELWPFRETAERGARARSVRVRTRLSVDNAAAAVDAALGGHGIICARSYQVAEHLAAGRLVRLLPGFEPQPIPTHVVFPPERAKKGTIRAFIEHAVPTLRRDLLQIESILSN